MSRTGPIRSPCPFKAIEKALKNGVGIALCVALCGALLLGVPSPAFSQQPVARVSLSEGDLDFGATKLEEWLAQKLQSEKTLGKSLDDKLIEIPASQGDTLSQVLALLRTQRNAPVRLGIRIPKDAVQIEIGKPKISVRHSRGDADLAVDLEVSGNRASARGLEVVLIEGQTITPLSDGAQAISVPNVEIELERVNARAKALLPEKGTEVRVSGLSQKPVSPGDLKIGLNLPETLRFNFQQKETGSGSVTLNAKAMSAIETAAHQAARQAIAPLINEYLTTELKERQTQINQSIEEFRSKFSLSHFLRQQVQSPLSENADLILEEIRARNSSSPQISEKTDEQRASDSSIARATLSELQEMFRLAPLDAGELSPPSIRAKLLRASIENLTSNWKDFSSKLDLESNEASATLQRFRDELVQALSGRASAQALAQLMGPARGKDCPLEGKPGETLFECKLRVVSQSLQEFIENDGLSNPALAEKSAQIHQTLIHAKLSTQIRTEISENSTRLRDRVVGIVETLKDFNQGAQTLAPFCIAPNAPSSPPLQAYENTLSFSAMNRQLSRMFNDGTLNLMLAPVPILKLRSPPVIEPGWDSEGKRIGFEQGKFTFKVQVEADGHPFDATIKASIKTSPDGKSLIFEAEEIKDFSYQASILEILFPPTLILAGVKNLVGSKDAKKWLRTSKRDGKNRVSLDLAPYSEMSGLALESFRINAKNPDELVILMKPNGDQK
jgi:hypothetical protein